MITPPYHFGIVAAPIGRGAVDADDQTHILYRGAFPAARNAPFLNRLGIKTLVCLRKKPFTEEDPIMDWTKRKGIDVQWIKAERIGEESLGMDRDEVNGVLKILLNPAAYPIYLADVDGISHTTLVVACLRKLQGWHQDSIINEIYRFEPDHDDLPLVPFITTYLSTSLPTKDDPGAALLLPAPPYPSWLWPAGQGAAQPTPQNARTTPPATTRSERAVSNASSSSAGTTGPLPFPNPLTARRHPNMRLTFSAVNPPVPADKTSAGLWRSNTAISRASATNDRPRAASPSRSREDTLLSQPDDTRPTPPRKVSFSDYARGSGILVRSPLVMPVPSLPGSSSAPRWKNGARVGETAGDDSALDDAEDGFVLDDPEDGDELEGDEEDEEEQDYDEDEDSDEYDEDEDDEEEEEDEDEPPTSQYISALDLAGFDR